MGDASEIEIEVKGILKNEKTPIGTRVVLWHLFAETHQSLNHYHLPGSQESRAGVRNELLDDLAWAHSILSTRTAELAEISAARSLWDWHVRYEKDSELKRLAIDLRSLYLSNEIAAEFECLFDTDQWHAHRQHAAEKAEELARGGRDAIDGFLVRAKRYLDDESTHDLLFEVALELGGRAVDVEGVRDFICAALGETSATARFEFSVVAGAQWAARQRLQDSASALEVVTQLADACGNNVQRVSLLRQLYGQLPRRDTAGKFSGEELLFLRSQEHVFSDAYQGHSFIACVAWGLGFQWQNLRDALDRVLDALDDEQLIAGIGSLVFSVYCALREQSVEKAPQDLAIWMLNQFLRVPNLDNLGDRVEWYASKIVAQVGKAPLAWLPEALCRRRELVDERGRGNAVALGHNFRLTRFVESIPQRGTFKAEDRSAICDLLDLVSDTSSVGYHLGKILSEVDPHGLVVPEEVAKRLEDEGDRGFARRYARVGSCYKVGTTAWRTVAKPILARAASAHSDELRILFTALTDRGPRTWSSPIGEVASIFKSAVVDARQHLEAETDADFRPFWEWFLAHAEAELLEQEEDAKEERGE